MPSRLPNGDPAEKRRARTLAARDIVGVLIPATAIVAAAIWFSVGLSKSFEFVLLVWPPMFSMAAVALGSQFVPNPIAYRDGSDVLVAACIALLHALGAAALSMMWTAGPLGIAGPRGVIRADLFWQIPGPIIALFVLNTAGLWLLARIRSAKA